MNLGDCCVLLSGWISRALVGRRCRRYRLYARRTCWAAMPTTPRHPGHQGPDAMAAALIVKALGRKP